MNTMYRVIHIIITIVLTGVFLLSQPVHAANPEFKLVLTTTGALSRGQDIQFAVQLDTKGNTIKAQQIGLTPDIRYIQYLSASPGEAMSTVEVQTFSDGRILLSGTNPSGFSSSGVFAYVNFKIIADAPGDTTLCSFWNPNSTPTPIPPPGATNTPVPPGAGEPTPLPTRLPRSGSATFTQIIGIIGAFFLVISTTSFFASNSFSKLSFKKNSKKTT